MRGTHKQCKGCLKVNRAGECMAFSDVEYQHKRKDGCYGKVTKPEQMAKMYEDMARYTISEQVKKDYMREAQRWRAKNGQA